MSTSVNLMINTDLSAPSRKRKTISLTALIDVVFILLMFFMLTSTFIKWHTLELQTALAGSEVVQVETARQTQLVIIREAGDFSLLVSEKVLENSNQSEQKFSALAGLIKQIDLNVNTVLIPEPKIKVQQITDTLTFLKKSGVTQVTLGNVLEE